MFVDLVRCRHMPGDRCRGIAGNQVDHSNVIRLTISRIGSAPSSRLTMMPSYALDQAIMRGSVMLNQTLAMRGIRNGSNPFTLDRTACTLVKDPNGTA